MNRINNFNQFNINNINQPNPHINAQSNLNYKGAIIEYTCSECCLANNFFIELNGISKVKPGNCEHFDMNFLLSSERSSMKLIISFNCKICQKNKMIELFNSNTKQNSGSITYKCIGCGNGNLSAGYLFQNEEITNFNSPPQKIMLQNFINKNEDINLIFVHKNKEYKIQIDPELSIPETFHKLLEKNKELENLNNIRYLKNGNPLSQYKSIKELNLKNGDKIDIESKSNQGWGS